MCATLSSQILGFLTERSMYSLVLIFICESWRSTDVLGVTEFCWRHCLSYKSSAKSNTQQQPPSELKQDHMFHLENFAFVLNSLYTIIHHLLTCCQSDLLFHLNTALEIIASLPQFLCFCSIEMNQISTFLPTNPNSFSFPS